MCLPLKESVRIPGLGLMQNESISLGSLRRYGSTRPRVSADFSAEIRREDIAYWVQLHNFDVLIGKVFTVF
jgi:hypothetical protein